jgi:F-type H+-transporting ATPase subunit gamma
MTFITAGRKAAQFISRTRRQLAAEFTYKDTPQFGEARAMSKFAQELFIKGAVDAVDVLFTKFISTLSQRPEIQPFLPVGKIQALTAGAALPSGPEEWTAREAAMDTFEFEPDEATVLGELLPHSLNFKVYQILLEARASEYSAKLVAMKNATENATQLIKELTLEYNKLRQANITRELLEIATAQLAVA